MTDPLRTAGDYEYFIYSLPARFPSIRRSTLRFIRLGTTLAKIVGELHFDHGSRLVVLERLGFERLPGLIAGYGYELWKGDEKQWWYDPQPHPDDPSLRPTQPHHKHVPPDMKHHRPPAPEMSFTRPNLPALVREIEELMRAPRAGG